MASWTLAIRCQPPFLLHLLCFKDSREYNSLWKSGDEYARSWWQALAQCFGEPWLWRTDSYNLGKPSLISFGLCSYNLNLSYNLQTVFSVWKFEMLFEWDESSDVLSLKGETLWNLMKQLPSQLSLWEPQLYREQRAICRIPIQQRHRPQTMWIASRQASWKLARLGPADCLHLGQRQMDHARWNKNLGKQSKSAHGEFQLHTVVIS